MRKPGPALGFYLKHGNDASVLAELGSRPDGVAESDWKKFRTVVDMATEEVVDLLLVCRQRIEASLGDAIVPIDESGKSQAKKQWDAWREFKAPGKGKNHPGWLGVVLDVRDDEAGWLFGYLRPKDGREGVRLRHALGATAPTAEHPADFTSDMALVVQVPVRSDTDLEQVEDSCGQAFAAIRDRLRAHLTGTAGPR